MTSGEVYLVVGIKSYADLIVHLTGVVDSGGRLVKTVQCVYIYKATVQLAIFFFIVNICDLVMGFKRPAVFLV